MADRVVSSRTAFKPASEHGPCAQCPWRTTNQGTRHPGGWYTKANLARLWGGLRRGERMTCHPTDPDNQPVPAGTVTRECSGAVILVQREMTRVDDVLRAGGSLGDYRRANPSGLTRDGVAEHVSNLMFGGAWPPGSLPVAKPNLNDDAVGYERLVAWEPRQRLDP